MPRLKSSPLKNIIGRIENLDPSNLAILAQRLARERDLLETVFDALKEGVLVIDPFGHIEFANSASEKLLGFSSTEGRTAILWKLAPDLTRTLNLTVDGQYKDISIITRELQLSYPENRSVRLYIMPFSAQGKEDEARFAVILWDVTEEKVQTQKEVEDEKLSSVLLLAAGVAHEIGNPLNSLTIHLQLMQRLLKNIKDEKIRKKLNLSLDVCMGEVERFDGIIKHFLEAVRPQEPDFKDTSVINVLEEVLEFQRQELEDADILVDVEMSEDVPVISADWNLLKQVFFNVLKNAREAMSHGGTIRIRTRSDDEFVFVQIGDTGIGIEKNEMSKVFLPYFSTKKSGHGLGMMIVERVMRDHGGQVGIDSRRDVGTVVTLQFPQKHRRVRFLER